MINGQRLARGLIDWGQNDEPLADRATLLPIGQYEDGSLTLAWPGFLKDSWDAANREYTRQVAVSEGRMSPEDAARASAPRRIGPGLFDFELGDGLNAASVGPMGGVVGRMAGAIPRGALGSGGSDMVTRSSDLPMDQASRLARAKEMGFDTDRVWYHGSQADNLQAFDMGKVGTGFGYSDEPVAWLTSNRDAAEQFARRSWDEDDGSGGVFSLLARTPKVRTIDEAGPYHHDNWNEILRGSQNDGYDAVLFRNALDDGLVSDQLAVFDPRNLRFDKAAFDPAQSASANLLAANPDTASLPALASQALQQPRGIRAYHGTSHDVQGSFRPEGFGTHFGTPEQSAKILEIKQAAGVKGSHDGAVYPVDIEANRVFEGHDMQHMDPRFLIRDLRDAEPVASEMVSHVDSLVQSGRRQEAFDVVRSAFADAGYDAYRYRNRVEGDGWSYVPLRPGTVRSATTGELLYANPDTASLPAIFGQAQAQEQPVNSLLASTHPFGPQQIPRDRNSIMGPGYPGRDSWDLFWENMREQPAPPQQERPSPPRQRYLATR